MSNLLLKKYSGAVDHDLLINTHNLTTDIDHNTITNNHNLTSDIDHNTILNNHNLTTDIDHDLLTNYVANEHIDWTNASDDLVTTADVSASDFIITGNNISSANTIHLKPSGDNTNFLSLSSVTSQPSFTLNTSFALNMFSDSDYVYLYLKEDATNAVYLGYHKSTAAGGRAGWMGCAGGDWNIYVNNNQGINFIMDADFDDYIRMTTASHQSTLNWVGQDGRITADSGTIDFDDENLTTTGKITGNEVEINGNLNHDGSNVGFYGTAPVAKPTVVGAKGGNVALTNLLTALANLGLIVDSTT